MSAMSQWMSKINLIRVGLATLNLKGPKLPCKVLRSAWGFRLRPNWLWILFLVLRQPLFGVSRDIQINQLHHTAWTADNAGIGEVRQVVQTSDGFLWLVTSDDRLLRFDGIRFDPIEKAMAGVIPTGEHRWDDVFSVDVDQSGGLWIGHSHPRVDFLKGGQLHTFSTQNCSPNAPIEKLAQDQDGILWIATRSGLGRMQGSQCNAIAPSGGYAGGEPVDLKVGRDGTLWVKGSDGQLYFLHHGAKTFAINASGAGSAVPEGHLAEAPDGTIWQSSPVGIQRILPASDNPRGIRAPMLGPHAGAYAIRFDTKGALWFSMADGLHRIAHPEKLVPWQLRPGEHIPAKAVPPSAVVSGDIQTFTAEQGLSSDLVWDLFEDREGNIWTATGGGLDRFRDDAFIRAPLPPSSTGQFALAAGAEGTVWTANFNSPLFNVGEHLLSTHPLSDKSISALYRDPTGCIWFGTAGNENSIWRLSGSTFVNAGELPERGGRSVMAISMDHAGGLWASLTAGGIFRLNHGVWTRENDQVGIPTSVPIYSIKTDDRGRVWFNTGRVVVLLDGDKVQKFDHTNGIVGGYATSMEVRGAHTWLGGLFGLALLFNGHFQVIKGTGGEVFHVTTGIIERADGDLWINTAAGAKRIPAAEVQKVTRDPAYQVQFESFDSLDGLEGTATYWIPVPTAIAGLDGKLWFSTKKGVFWVDPDKVTKHRNLVPPPVFVNIVTTGGKQYPILDNMQLPVRTESIQFDYTALSLTMPERVSFRYRLDGVDRQWQDAGTRRQAFYTNLSPGNYRFQVIACNEAGVWNDTGAVLKFAIAPAWYQTRWFKFLCVLAMLGALWAIYAFRLAKVSADLNERLRVRLIERERIARELHDTLLQGFQASVMNMGSAARKFPEAEPARKSMDEALEIAREVLREGRDRVKNLRDTDDSQTDLVEQLRQFCGRLESDRAKINLAVEGIPRPITSIASEELFQICKECLVNASLHSNATEIICIVIFDARSLSTVCRDNGRGIAEETLSKGYAEGHFGLVGMRERAARLHAVCTLESKEGQGTTVTVRVPRITSYVATDWQSRLLTRLNSIWSATWGPASMPGASKVSKAK